MAIQASSKTYERLYTYFPRDLKHGKHGKHGKHKVLWYKKYYIVMDENVLPNSTHKFLDWGEGLIELIL